MTGSLPQFEIVATPEAVCRWMIGRDDALPDDMPTAGDEVPLTWLFFLRCQPATATSIHAALGRDPDRGLFGGVRYVRERPVRVGDILSSQARITDRKTVDSPRGAMVLSTLTNEWSVNGRLAVTETVRMVDLPPGPPVPPAAGPEADATLAPLGDAVSFTPRQIAWLTVETGDLNPLHVDRNYATGRLFSDVVVPGTLIAPLVEKRLSHAAGAPVSMLDIRFRAATYPGESIVVTAAQHEGGWAFEIVGSGRVRAAGSAEVAS